MGNCLICGVQLYGNKQYCETCYKSHINELAKEYYRKKRGQRHCKKCGSEIPDYKQYCDKCRSTRWRDNNFYQKWLKEVNDQADIKRREFIEKGEFGELEYVGGFTSGNCKVTLRCKTCGSERQLTIDGIRSVTNGHNATLRCRKCHPKDGRPWDEWMQIRRKREEEQKAATAIRKEKERMEKLRIVECAICGNTFQTFQANQKTCSDECRKKRRNQYIDHRIPKDAIVDRDITLATLFQRDKGVCYICGCTCDWNDIEKRENYVITGPKYPSIDHVIPVSRGGKHEWKNVRLACRECNSKKTDISPSEFLGTDDFVPENAEILKRVPNKQKKTVEQMTVDGKLIARYESTADAERKTGFKDKQIQNCARGEKKTYMGFVWKYA